MNEVETAPVAPRHPEYIEALARGLEIIKCFGTTHRELTLSEVAVLGGLSRGTTRRILITLVELGYVRASGNSFTLSPRILELGMSYVASSGLWNLARPHLAALVDDVAESCSIAVLDAPDIVYVARVAVPKLVTLAVDIGTRFPAAQTSLGTVLLASLDAEELSRVLDQPSRSHVRPAWNPRREDLDLELSTVRAQGWALTDQQLAPAIRSVAAPIRNGAGEVIAAVNVNSHAAETPLDVVLEQHLPRVLRTASDISRDVAAWDARPFEMRPSATSRMG